MKDYYQMLGITPQASEHEIKSTYRKLAKKYHPDVVSDNPGLLERMYEIQEAYEHLSDGQKRKKYDEARRNQGHRYPKEKVSQEKTGAAPNMTQFEHFFGFQAGGGMNTYQDKHTCARKADGPINPEELFAAYFGKKSSKESRRNNEG